VSYTGSHALRLGTVYNPYNLDFGYGNTSFNTRHNLTADVVWKLAPYRAAGTRIHTGRLDGRNQTLRLQRPAFPNGALANFF